MDGKNTHSQENYDRLVRVEDGVVRVVVKVDGLTDAMAAIQRIQAIHNEQLAEHMRRTELLEARDTEFAKLLEPIAKHVDRINWLAALIATLATMAAAGFGVASYFKH